jgi:ribosomal protein S6E (S10)
MFNQRERSSKKTASRKITYGTDASGFNMYKSTDGIRANEKEKKLLQSLKYCFKVVLLSQKLL